MAPLSAEAQKRGRYARDSSYFANPKYDGMARRAIKYQPDRFNFSVFRSYYAQTRQYDPFGDLIGEQMLDYAYIVQSSQDPEEVEDALLAYKKLVSDHLPNIGVVVQVLALAREDQRFGNINFFRWMREGIMEVVLRSGNGKSWSTAYKVMTLGEESLLLTYLNLNPKKTEVSHMGRLYYNMHLVEDPVSNEEYTFFVDATYPLSKAEQNMAPPDYGVNIRRQ